MRLFFKYFLAIILLFLSLMWLQSYSFYNSVGLDLSYPSESGFITTHYRIRWPGNGSFWMGRIAREYIPNSNSKMELELGGAIFQSPSGPEIKTIWQWLGFWWIEKREAGSDFAESSGLLNTWENWLGIPSWLLPVSGSMWWISKYKKEFKHE